MHIKFCELGYCTAIATTVLVVNVAATTVIVFHHIVIRRSVQFQNS